jgi:ATP-dependent exoDNAse (exonuclease V) alpha subunit
MKQKDAFEILKQGHNVLLTGFAGSGKSYLLEEFAYWARYKGESVVMTATTGIAATNINGKTIHNYSNLGISERIDLENQERVISLANNMKQPYKTAVINTDILVIDEISMLHDYQLSAVDKIIRIIRNNDSPFGGLQVILCGDFFQLPPIARNNGQTNFITQSDSYINGNFKVCYLEENWKLKKDDPLGSILNAIRSSKLKDEHYTLLKQRIRTKLSEQNTTKLYCTVKNIDIENNLKLNQLVTGSRYYNWEENGDATELNKLKNDCKNKVVENLELKIGALVMFVKNNLRLGYSNGTSGKVISFDNNGYPNIELNNGKILNGIEKDDFYREDEYGNRLATIKQIPLKLAWAITIHKSQGMTLDKVTIDLTNAFTSGQGYVALSRVRSINDISLIGLNKIALTVSQEALNIENELQEKSKQALKCLTIEKPDISSNPDIIVEPPPIIDRIKIVNLITYWIANKLREFIK